MGGKSKHLLMLRIGILLSLIMYILCISNRPIQTVYAVPDIFKPGIHAAESVTYTGNSGGRHSYKEDSIFPSSKYVEYNNESLDNSKYAVFNKAIRSEGEDYDIVIYPYKGSRKAILGYEHRNLGKVPLFSGFGNGNEYYKMFITKHGNINEHVDMDILIGSSDLDNTEYVAFPKDSCNLVYKGVHVNEK